MLRQCITGTKDRSGVCQEAAAQAVAGEQQAAAGILWVFWASWLIVRWRLVSMPRLDASARACQVLEANGSGVEFRFVARMKL